MLTETLPILPAGPDGIPELEGLELDEFAQNEVAAFAPAQLKEAGPFDIQKYLRGRMGCRILCRRLSLNGSCWGAVCFRTSAVDLFDTGHAERVMLQAGTVLLERSLLIKPEVGRFTLAHEAGHLFLHRLCFESCSAENGGELRRLRILEAQADRFALGLLMNRTAALWLWDELDKYTKIFYEGDETAARTYKIATFASRFGVSRSAARLRLKTLYLD